VLLNIVRVATYPLMLVASVLGGHFLLRSGADATVTVAAINAVAALVIFALQRFIPYEDAWRKWREDLRVDLLHTVLSSGAVPALCKAVLWGVSFQAAQILSGWIGSTLWPTDWDMLPQLGLALVVGELGHYWGHRWMHRSKVGWALHAVHHSSERLYVLSTARSHPLNVFTIYLLSTTPLLLLGAKGEVLALFSLVNGVNGFLQHCNVDLRTGPLHWIFATPDLHRFHHSTDPREGDSNFGGNLIVWDVIFGTRYLPGEGRGPKHVGLTDASMIAGYVRHLGVPFLWRRLVSPRARAYQGSGTGSS
jgi:sterol desaturase/sphingolipid hydroxylase (fatty acid hydroxylase superfamily)